MNDQERKQKRQQALEEYQQIVTYELPALVPGESAPPPRQARRKKHFFLKFFASALLVAGMAVCYFFIGNWISSIRMENRALKEELANNEAQEQAQDMTAEPPQTMQEPSPAAPITQETRKETEENDVSPDTVSPQEPPSTEESQTETPSPDGSFTAIYPLRGSSTILRTFGAYTDDEGNKATSYGLALGTDSDTQVIAAGGGTVIYAEDNPSTGLTVQIDHQNGYITEYTMNKELLVSTGQAVAVGQPIAVMGTEGEDGLKHMEFRVLYDGNFIDPEQVLKIVG